LLCKTLPGNRCVDDFGIEGDDGKKRRLKKMYAEVSMQNASAEGGGWDKALRPSTARQGIAQQCPESGLQPRRFVY